MSLNNLGVYYNALGRRHDAVAPTEDAVTIRRQLAATNPAFLNDLASSLNNLGVYYSEFGRLNDADLVWDDTSVSSPINRRDSPSSHRAVHWLAQPTSCLWPALISLAVSAATISPPVA